MYRAFERVILDVVFEPLGAYDITRKGTRPIPSREFETSIEHHFPKSLGHSFLEFDFGTPVPEHFRHVSPYVGASRLFTVRDYFPVIGAESSALDALYGAHDRARETRHSLCRANRLPAAFALLCD